MIARLVGILVGVVLAVGIGGFGLIGSTIETQAATTDVGYRDFSFGTVASSPTDEKPQSKLWFNDGIWWGSLWNPSTSDWEIYRFDWTAHTWSSTGTLLEGRANSKADTLWDGTHLYVATAPRSTTTTDQNAYVRRYSYDGATKKYTLDFRATVATGTMEAIVLDKDTTGKLWVTYTQGSKVYVNRSLGSDSTWGTPFVLPVSGTTVDPDDISALVSFDRQNAAPQIGVMWSNQVDNAMYFATHKDGDPDDVWQPPRVAIGGPNSRYADDHINLKSLEADSSGRVFAAVKTSLTSPDAPGTLLLRLNQDNAWSSHVFGRVSDDHTRPMVMIDETHRTLYMFATAPVSPGGTIYYKKTSLDNISFEQGLGTPFIKSSTDTTINNATSTKQNLNAKTGLLVVASDDTSNFYLHNTIDLGSTPPADTTPPTISLSTPPDGATYSLNQVVNANYDCADETGGSGLSSCAGPVPDGTAIDTSTTGTKSFTVTAKDNAQNTASLTHNYTVEANPSSSCTITGTSNADTISGTSGNDIICGGDGNDTIKGLGGNDILKGEAGNDTLLGGKGDDTLDGGLGSDTVSYSGSLTAVIASLATNSATGEGADNLVGAENLLGSSKADTLTGSGEPNTLTGGGGDDTERGGAGNDIVKGSGGADNLFGEDGNDALQSKDGVNGNDSLDGGPGTDTKVTDATEKSIVGFP